MRKAACSSHAVSTNFCAFIINDFGGVASVGFFPSFELNFEDAEVVRKVICATGARWVLQAHKEMEGFPL